MFCGECGADLKKGKKFCNECGAKVEIEKEKVVEAPSKKKEKTVFCGECGRKNKSTESFCGECGTKLDIEEAEEVKEQIVVEQKQPLDPKKKRTITVVAVVLVALAIGYFTLSTLANPDRIADSFCDGMVNKDYKKIYNNLDLPKSSYLSYDNFKTLLTEDYNSLDSCTTEEVGTDANGNKEYKINATLDGQSDTTTIVLNKKDSKRFLLFDNYKIDVEDLVKEEWVIKVPAGSVLYVEGNKITEKDEDNSTTSLDTYIIKNVFYTEYEIKVTHDLRKDVNDKYIPSYYSVTTIELDVNEEIKESVDLLLQKLYEVALLDKEYSHVEGLIDESYTSSAKTLITNIRSTVEDNASWYYKVTGFQDIDIEDMEISNIEIKSDGNIKFRVDYYLSYKYTTEYYTTPISKTTKYYFQFELTKESNQWLLIERY